RAKLPAMSPAQIAEVSNWPTRSPVDDERKLCPRIQSGTSEDSFGASEGTVHAADCNENAGQTGAAGEPTKTFWGFLAPPQNPDEIGRLGPYRILKVLGSGGMGVAFQAEDPKLKRKLAIKAMLPALAASASARQRFLREAQTAAAIEHDHIVAIHQV